MPVEGPDAKPRSTRDLVQRRVDAAFREDRARRRDEKVVVALRVTPYRALRAGQLGHTTKLAETESSLRFMLRSR